MSYQSPIQCPIKIFPQRWEGGHTGAIESAAIIDTGLSPGAGLLTFLVEKDWERVIVHTREELSAH